MNKRYLENFWRWGRHFIHAQLFITLIGFPIMLAWGLPCSLFAPLGNLIFSPLLTLFLFASSLLFFTELISIPNTPIVYVLEKIGQLWLTIAHACPKDLLVTLPCPSWPILWAIPAITMLIIHAKRIRPSLQVCLFSLLLLSVGSIIHYTQYRNDTLHTIPCHTKTLSLIRVHNQQLLVDPGALGQRVSVSTWIEYTLVPTITRATGNRTIDHLVLLSPNGSTYDAVTTLLTFCTIHTIYCCPPKKPLSPTSQQKLFRLKQKAQKEHVLLKEITTEPYTITFSPETILTIQQKTTSTTPLNSYGAHCIQGTCANKPLYLSPA